MLSAVVAIARSPSSAIAVVTELQADGPFTQTMLGVTMVTDVVVILLFTAAAKLGETMLDPTLTPSLTPILTPILVSPDPDANQARAAASCSRSTRRGSQRSTILERWSSTRPRP